MPLRSNYLRKTTSSFLAVLILTPTLLFGQRDSLAHRGDVIRFADGVVFTFTAPARWDSKDLLVLGGMIAGTTALSFADQTQVAPPALPGGKTVLLGKEDKTQGSRV